jgi:hypothetical protein
MNIIRKPVSNFAYGRFSGKQELAIKAVVIHIAQGYLSGAHSWFNNPASGASSHYMIGKKGEIWNFVDERNTAWHAGGIANPTKIFTDNFNIHIDPNAYTIGIENEGFTGERFTNEMIKSLQDLLFDIATRYGWERYEYGKNIITHSEINTKSRSQCPGIGIHITNDLIIPVNQILMKDQELYDAISNQREDARQNLNAGTVPSWWLDYGFAELLEKMFYAYLNGTLKNYIGDIKIRENSFLPTNYTPRGLRDMYVKVISKNGNIWKEKYSNTPISDNTVTWSELKKRLFN